TRSKRDWSSDVCSSRILKKRSWILQNPPAQLLCFFLVSKDNTVNYHITISFFRMIIEMSSNRYLRKRSCTTTQRYTYPTPPTLIRTMHLKELLTCSFS